MSNQKHLPCFAEQVWEWDGVSFEVLHPSFDSYENTEIKDNNRSCVLRITSLFGSLLLVGDIEIESEAELLQNESEKLGSDVLVVPHHGSKTSSTPEFIAAVNPQISIFTLGYLNRFGHPKTEIWNCYQQAQSHLFRSDQDGAVLIDFAAKNSSLNAFKPNISEANTPDTSPSSIQVMPWRRANLHYWHTE